MKLRSRAVVPWLRVLVVAAFLIAGAIVPLTANAADVTADHVMGQIDFAHNIVNDGGGNGLFAPGGIAFDKTTKLHGLYIADSQNSRVLGWSDVTKLSNGSPADIVIGQADFNSSFCRVGARSLCAPTAVGVDSRGDLYVVDRGNSRVLVFSSPLAQFRAHGTQHGFTAIAVFGQGTTGKDFTHNSCNGGTVSTPTASGLCFPSGVTIDFADNLYVADWNNNRVLLYFNPLANPASPDVIADVVFGQGPNGTAATAFTTRACANGAKGNPAVSATGMCRPAALALDSAKNLYVADQSNNRVVVYLNPLAKPGSPNVTASIAFGQGGKLTSNICGDGIKPDPAPSAANLCAPSGVALDSGNNLYIADQMNSRVLEYADPLRNSNMPKLTASRVFGQGPTGTNFSANICANGFGFPNRVFPNANGLCGPAAVALDPTDNLYVSDGGLLNIRFIGRATGVAASANNNNNRLLIYHTPLNPHSGEPGAGDVTADIELGQKDFSHRTPNFGSPKGLAALTVAMGFAIAGDHFISYGIAGEPEITVVASLGYPAGIALAIDNSTTPAGAYVADSGSSRVLGWSNIGVFISGGAPDIVIGQPDFISSNCNDGGAAGDVRGFGPDSLCLPTGAAVDRRGNLYVADLNNSRVLEYASPLKIFKATGQTRGFSAHLVFGQGPSGRSFTTSACGQPSINSTTMCMPFGVALDKNDNLYVADTSNNRVLEFNAPLANPAKPNVTANHVFGQNDDFTKNVCSDGVDGPLPSAAGLCFPESVAIDSQGNAYIANSHNNRVLEYKLPFGSSMGCKPKPDGSGCPGDRVADLVFGQSPTRNSPGPSDFTDNNCNAAMGEESAFRTCLITEVAIDQSDNLYAVDQTNHRVLEFFQPLAPRGVCKPKPDGTGCPGDVVADKVFGQGPTGASFTTNVCADGNFGTPAPGASSMCQPFGVTIDGLGDVFISDDGNNRILQFD